MQGRGASDDQSAPRCPWAYMLPPPSPPPEYAPRKSQEQEVDRHRQRESEGRGWGQRKHGAAQKALNAEDFLLYRLGQAWAETPRSYPPRDGAFPAIEAEAAAARQHGSGGER
jgi:hypothetical protein